MKAEIASLRKQHEVSIRLLNSIETLYGWIQNLEKASLYPIDRKRINRYKKAARKNFADYITLNGYDDNET
jgi:hypothetical protein